MEGIFQLSLANSLTVATIEEILAGRILAEYTPEIAIDAVVYAAAASMSLTDFAALAIGLGAEMPPELTRLFMLLQADAIVKNEPVLAAAAARLLEFYRYGILPQVFTQGLFGTPTTHVLLPVFGESKVYYQGYLLQAADIHDIFSWQPVPWLSVLPATLAQDASFGLSYLIYSFLQFQKLYRFTQTILPTISDHLFPGQISQLEEQLNQALAQPQNQQLSLSGIANQLEKLLTKCGEQVAQYFGKYTSETTISIRLVTENRPVAPAYIQQLVETLAMENLFLYQSGSGDVYENTTEPTTRLLIQPYRLLQNLEQLLALVALVHLTEPVTAEAPLNIPADLPAAYRKQVLNVLKGATFNELIQKTITFMYATVTSH